MPPTDRRPLLVAPDGAPGLPRARAMGVFAVLLLAGAAWRWASGATGMAAALGLQAVVLTLVAALHARLGRDGLGPPPDSCRRRGRARRRMVAVLAVALPLQAFAVAPMHPGAIHLHAEAAHPSHGTVATDGAAELDHGAARPHDRAHHPRGIGVHHHDASTEGVIALDDGGADDIAPVLSTLMAHSRPAALSTGPGVGVRMQRCAPPPAERFRTRTTAPLERPPR